MQATYSTRRSPVWALAAVLVVLGALLLGAMGGYMVKGLEHQSIVGSRPATTFVAPASAVQVSGASAGQSTRWLKNHD